MGNEAEHWTHAWGPSRDIAAVDEVAEGLVERPLPSSAVSLARNSAGGPVICEQDECTEETGEGRGRDEGCGLHELWRLLGWGRFRL